MKIDNNMSQDNRCELFGCLIDVVEDWLESKGIAPADIPNEDRDRDDGWAIIYGEDYDELANGFAAVLGIDRDEIILNEAEKKLVERINTAKLFVKGEVEVDLFDDAWYVMDYIEERGEAIPLEIKGADLPLITEANAKQNGIDVGKCCDFCNVYIVG